MKSLILCFIFLLSLPSWAKFNADFQGLVIGADESFIQTEEQLNYASTDAERVAKAMRTAGRVKHGAIRQLKNPTMAQFNKAISKLKKKKTKKFMFYFSGHSDENGLHLKDGSITKSTFPELITFPFSLNTASSTATNIGISTFAPPDIGAVMNNSLSLTLVAFVVGFIKADI